MSRLAAAPRIRFGRLVLVAALVLAAAGCDLLPIPGEAPLRYRDAVFTTTNTTSNIVYGTAVNFEGQTINLLADVYRPTGDSATGRPLIIWVHGGGFSGGTKTSPEIVDQATQFALKGYVNASISYRLRPGGCGIPSQCLPAIADARTDAQNAVRFFRTNAATYGIDPDRIAIGGTSAGAITALGVAYGSDASASVSGASSLSGALLFNTLADPSDPKTLLFHGTADTLVPYAWAESTVSSAAAAGLEAYLVTWQGEGHVPYLQHRQQILDLQTNFFYRQLDAGNAGGA